MKKFSADTWRDIKDFDGKYQVSFSGQIRRVYKSGKTRILKPYTSSKGSKKYKRTKQKLYVGLTKDGKKKVFLVHQIVAEHFLPKPKKGQVIYHKNKMLSDNWANNLAYISREDLGRLTGAGSRRKPVVKINRDGEIVDCYTSAREAGRQNYMSYQTVMDKCNLTSVKRSIFAPDGYAYAWEDDDKSFNATIRRIELETQGEDAEVISRIKETEPKYQFDF